jgi:hypothetical protein
MDSDDMYLLLLMPWTVLVGKCEIIPVTSRAQQANAVRFC